MRLVLRAVCCQGTAAGAVVERAWEDGERIIGRHPPAELVLADPDVSPRHARLRLREGHWTLCDLGSVHGTRLGGRPLVAGREERLQPGDEIELGAWRIAVAEAEEPAGPPSPAGVARALVGQLLAEGPGTGAVELEVLAGSGNRKHCALVSGQRLTIGRARRCGLVLDDPRVSRLHAVLEVRPDGVWLEDRGSTNGCRLAGRAVRGRRRWPAGERLSLGAAVLGWRLARADAGWTRLLRERPVAPAIPPRWPLAVAGACGALGLWLWLV